ncbi:retrotransposon protein, putative, ty1-copia subclass, partial [Tanacetum coccineum]
LMTDCNHPKTVEDFYRQRTPDSAKLQRSAIVSEIPKYDAPLKKRGFPLNKDMKNTKRVSDNENQNPNLSTPPNNDNFEQIREAKEGFLIIRLLCGGNKEVEARKDVPKRLVGVQKAHDSMEMKERFGGGGLKSEAEKDDGSNKRAPSAGDYFINKASLHQSKQRMHSCTQQVKPKLTLIQVELSTEAFHFGLCPPSLLIMWVLRIFTYSQYNVDAFVSPGNPSSTEFFYLFMIVNNFTSINGVLINDRQMLRQFSCGCRSCRRLKALNVAMALPVHNINHSAFRSMFDKEKLSGNNFNDWFARLKLVLRVEKKMHVIEQPLPPALEPVAEPEIVAQWTALYDAHTEIACLMLGTGVEKFDLIQSFHACKQEEGKPVADYVLKMKGYVEKLERLGYVLPQDISVGLILNGLEAQIVLVLRVDKKMQVIEQPLPPAPEPVADPNVELRSMFEKQAGVEKFDLIQSFHACKQKEGKPDISVGLILNGLTKDFVGFVRNYNMHNMGKTIGEIHAMLIEFEKGLPKKAETPQGKDKKDYISKAPKEPEPAAYDAQLRMMPATTGFRIERKLKRGALYLYVGNGVRAQVEAIGSFDLVLPNGLVICLDNYHYAPTITRGVVSVSCLVDNRFDQCFTDYGISISKNGVHYFNAIVRNGIYEIDMHDLVSNVNSIYNVSNKRVKHNLDSTYLWHCRLAHINKKRIKQLQQDGLLKSMDDESFDKCESCLSGKMTKKLFPYRNERAKDLLGIIHTDMCGPLRHVSRQGASYFITFTDDYSRYGYVYLLKHKHEVFETFKLTPPYTPQHNEVSERRNRTLFDMVRSMMNLTTLPLSFWDYALRFRKTAYLNMVPTKKVEKTPYELWIPNGNDGYITTSHLKTKLFVASILEFFEKRLISQEISGRAVDLEEIQEEEDTTPSEITSNIPQEVEGFEPPQEDVIPIHRSKRTHRAPNRLCLNVEVEEHSLGDLNEPTSYKAAMLDLESNKWIDAMNAEIQSMMDNMVWVLVDLPLGCKTVGSKWLFKKKTDMDGIVHVYKAHLVVEGYTQLYGVDYEEMFSLVADIRAIRILISIAAYYDYEIWQMDVKIAFLNGYLDEEIYMVQPEGFVDPNHLRKVCKLQRSIYGLKQASRSWNKRFDEEIKRFGFAQNLDEPCVYQKASGSNVTFLILYVDDIIIMGNHIPSLQSVKDYLGKCFAMKDLGEAAFILGIKIYRDRSKRLIRLSQNAYMDKILKRYKMDNSKRGHIPMQERLDLNKSQGAQTPKENPSELHWTAVKNILKYLRNTKDMLLVYGGNPSTELRVEYYCAVDWKSSKQSTTAMSATESEYIAASEAAMEAVWIKKFISGLGIVPTINEPLNMYCDNSAVVYYANELGVQKAPDTIKDDIIIVPVLVASKCDCLEWRDGASAGQQVLVQVVWNSIRSRDVKVPWFELVWFRNCIPRHAVNLWLIIKRQLKTQDLLRSWDVAAGIGTVWSHLNQYAGMRSVGSSMQSIISYLIPLAKRKTTRSVIGKIVVAATAYFVWQERNRRLFKGNKRSVQEIIECTMTSIRLKLLSCRFKKSNDGVLFARLWDLPEAIFKVSYLEKKIDDGIEKLEASIKAMKEESNAKLDAKFEELRQLILGTPPSQSTHVDHNPQITKVAAKTTPYVPPIRRCYHDIGLELHNSNAESSIIIGKNLRPKYWDVKKFHKSIIAAIKEEKNQEEGQVPSFRVQLNQRGYKSRMKARLFWKKFVVACVRPRKPRKLFTSLGNGFESLDLHEQLQVCIRILKKIYQDYYLLLKHTKGI